MEPVVEPSSTIVHGRFQPFHNEHLAYLRLAAARSEELIVGITNPARECVSEEAWDRGRHRPEENPFTYWERMLMIEAVLESEELDGRIVPFPISHPERLRQYVPARGTHYLRVFDAWGEEKVRRLQALGHDVVVLEPGTDKALSAGDVRALMRDGGAWQELVPAAVARVVEGLRHEADRRPPA
jgi:cytidyltransferase-like protein